MSKSTEECVSITSRVYHYYIPLNITSLNRNNSLVTFQIKDLSGKFEFSKTPNQISGCSSQFQATEDNPERIPTFTMSPPKVSSHYQNPQTQLLGASNWQDWPPHHNYWSGLIETSELTATNWLASDATAWWHNNKINVEQLHNGN